MNKILSWAHCVSAAVYGKRNTRAKGGLIRRQKGDGFRHLLGGAGAPKRMRRARTLQECRVGRFVHAATLVDVGDDDAGVDRVDADILGSELKSHATGHLGGSEFV